MSVDIDGFAFATDEFGDVTSSGDEVGDLLADAFDLADRERGLSSLKAFAASGEVLVRRPDLTQEIGQGV